MITSIFKTLWQEEDGQDMVEYALLIAFVAIAAIALLGGVGNSVKSMWSNISSTLNSTAAS